MALNPLPKPKGRQQGRPFGINRSNILDRGATLGFLPEYGLTLLLDIRNSEIVKNIF
jgi:hypothetical protein